MLALGALAADAELVVDAPATLAALVVHRGRRAEASRARLCDSSASSVARRFVGVLVSTGPPVSISVLSCLRMLAFSLLRSSSMRETELSAVAPAAASDTSVLRDSVIMMADSRL
jgi:hypothetical protein